MPVHPTEEQAPEGIYEKVAKNPSSNTDSNASDHKLRKYFPASLPIHFRHCPDARLSR